MEVHKSVAQVIDAAAHAPSIEDEKASAEIS
jgi:hypothetical protein